VFTEREFRLLRKSRHGHLQNQARGSRLGSLYYDKITTLATLPSGGRPRYSRRQPCGGAAGCEAQRLGDAHRWGRHATPQPGCTRHPDGAPVAVEEKTAAVTKLIFVRLIAKGRKVIVCLLVGEEEDQAQELAMDTARGRHARRQKGHLPIASIWVTVVADLVSSSALEDVIWVVRVAVLTLIVP
jgi:hypothetical protein